MIGRTGNTTQCEWYAYLPFQQKKEYNFIHLGRRLLQEFVVDLYICIERSRLNFIRKKQARLKGNVSAVSIFHESCARIWAPIIVHHHDSKSTLARNVEQLGPGENSADRPDIVTRVFYLKLQSMMRDLTKKNFLGKVVSYVYTVEFQKQGLPHARILLILDREYVLNTAHKVDKLISAELPNPQKCANLYKLVTRNILHGPCSARFACWQNDKCKYGFPKPFSEHTMLVDGEYPIYKRRKNDSRFVKGSTIFTNKDVVTYSPFLLMHYECHINVEIVVSIKTMKYIYKYICKGEDRAVLSLKSKDETLDFVNGRYIGPGEAITRMAIHTEESHLFYFRDKHGARSQVEAGTAGKTTPTGYFKLNSKNAVSNGQPARSLFYSNIPKYFWWNKKRKEWEPRKMKILAVGRVSFARFTEGERYYLRLLLMNRKGAISFGDQRTVNGTQHSTYQDAELASGLLLSDKHYHDCLTDTTLWMSGKRLRQLFVIMLCNSPPADPKTLLDNHIEDLSDDCSHLLCHTYSIDEPSETLSQNLAKYFINEEMKEVGKSLNDYGIDMTDMEFDFISSFSEEPCSIDDGIYKKMLGQLTRPQKKIYQAVEQAVVSKEQLLCFVDGPGGSGKNILLNTIIGSLRNQGIQHTLLSKFH
ncbi:hypothetical protein O181_107708 [Austropuccinia psidii MF-1]|uniref:ATP-dependent DNA helicase n=1 Tax=Austropuccinia psidii MF-1 TaxID=1389203 RepID=A0A9Q3PN54_9BASI|nr:hypothetical protein [Austropuccinia psidii MF-1]